jgi:hypothetical protein
MKTNLIKHLMLMALIGWTNMKVEAQFDTNLRLNANGETGDMTDWNVEQNGGNGWYVGWGYRSSLPGSANPFDTSYGLDVRSETIDFLAVGVGSAFVFMCVIPSSHNHTSPVHIIGARPMLTITPDDGWTQISGSLEDYGSGLRYIVFEDGGQDQAG